MEGTFLKVEITTPNRQWSFDDVRSCSAPGVEGQFQILFNHAPMMSQLDIGEVKLETSQGEMLYATSGGFFEVVENKISLLLDTCEEAEKIDVNRAKEAADRAKKRLQEQSEKIDVARAEAAFARATNRLKVVQKVNVTA